METYRAIIFILDGVGDRPVPELDDKTPLRVARKPNMDYIAMVMNTQNNFILTTNNYTTLHRG